MGCINSAPAASNNDEKQMASTLEKKEAKEEAKYDVNLEEEQPQNPGAALTQLQTALDNSNSKYASFVKTSADTLATALDDASLTPTMSTNLTNGINKVTQNLGSFQSDNPTDVASGVIGVTAGVALMIPGGEVIGAVLGLAAGITSLLGGSSQSAAFETMITMAVDSIVSEIESTLKASTIDQLSSDAAGAAAAYTGALTFINAFIEDGITDIPAADMANLSGDVPVSLALTQLGGLRTHIEIVMKNSGKNDYTSNANQDNIAQNVAGSVRLMIEYVSAAIPRLTLLQTMQCIYQANNELRTAKGYKAEIEGQEQVDFAFFETMNTSNIPLWFTDNSNQASMTNCREYQKQVENNMELPNIPYAPLALTESVSINDKSSYAQYVGYVEKLAMNQSTYPLVGFGFWNNGNRIALAGIEPESFDSNVYYGSNSTINNDGTKNDNFWDINPLKNIDTSVVMVPHPQYQAVFGAQFYTVGYTYLNSDGDEVNTQLLCLKLLYGRVQDDGTGEDFAWTPESNLEQVQNNFGAAPNTPNGKWYFDTNLVQFAGASGYVVGAQMYWRENRISMKVYKTLPNGNVTVDDLKTN